MTKKTTKRAAKKAARDDIREKAIDWLERLKATDPEYAGLLSLVSDQIFCTGFVAGYNLGAQTKERKEQ